ncbi:MAG: hypothetical protein ABEJ30_08400 [Halorientalis sp.]
MDRNTLLGDVATLVVAVMVVGSIGTIALRLATSSRVVAAGATLAFVAVAVLVAVAAGSASAGSVGNPYW